MLERDLSHVVRGCIYEVYRQLGCGFLEKVYEKALITELKLQGSSVRGKLSTELATCCVR
jgi:GxxExxY protein